VVFGVFKVTELSSPAGTVTAPAGAVDGPVRTLALPQMRAGGVEGAVTAAPAITEVTAALAATIAVTVSRAAARFRPLLLVATQLCRTNHSLGSHRTVRLPTLALMYQVIGSSLSNLSTLSVTPTTESVNRLVMWVEDGPGTRLLHES
jgi:hypothetical protein